MSSEVDLALDRSVCQQVAQHLSLILSDTYLLYTKTQNFHWNMIDTRFYFLHKLLEEQYEELAKAIDELAERIRMLGEKSPGSMKQFLERTTLIESEGDLTADEMLANLMKDHEALCRYLRERISHCSKLGDEGTADLFIAQLRFHEKSAWILRSHLEE